MLYGLLLAVLVLAGCAGPSPGVVAPPAAADRVVALPSGATLKVVADWTVTAAPDGFILEDPEKHLDRSSGATGMGVRRRRQFEAEDAGERPTGIARSGSWLMRI